MAGIESEVLEEFLAKLQTTHDVPVKVTEQLGSLLADEKLPKVDQLVAQYMAYSGDLSA